jgi:hypothetical protein
MAEGSSLLSCTTPGRQDRFTPHCTDAQPHGSSRAHLVWLHWPGELTARGRMDCGVGSSGGPGGSRGVVPPVPFPNTVVKRPSANDTAWATAWDNRPVPGPPLTPFSSGPVSLDRLLSNPVYFSYATRDGAVVARRAHNPKVVGSNPTPATSQGQRITPPGPFFLPYVYHSLASSSIIPYAPRPHRLEA